MKKVKDFFEALVIIAIILVLVQTFLEDLVVLLGWPWSMRKILVFTGFGFDLFFTLEFLTRLYFSIIKGKARNYIFKERGWIDFLASVPLLLLNSGPAVLAILGGSAGFIGMGGILNILKVVKAIRIARILRLLRVLKIFKQIKYADSVMAQRHITKISTMSISIIVGTILVVTFSAGFIGLPSLNETFKEKQMATVELLTTHLEAGRSRSLNEITAAEKELLIIKDQNNTIFSRYENSFYKDQFGPDDYRYLSRNNYGFFFDQRNFTKLQAKDNIMYFLMVIILVVGFLFFYSPHLAITVTDPIHVMKRGMEETSYNLEVKVLEEYSDDDIFQLAKAYNEKYLPMKDRASSSEGSDIVGLSMEDFSDIFDEDET